MAFWRSVQRLPTSCLSSSPRATLRQVSGNRASTSPTTGFCSDHGGNSANLGERRTSPQLPTQETQNRAPRPRSPERARDQKRRRPRRHRSRRGAPQELQRASDISFASRQKVLPALQAQDISSPVDRYPSPKPRRALLSETSRWSQPPPLERDPREAGRKPLALVDRV